MLSMKDIVAHMENFRGRQCVFATSANAGYANGSERRKNVCVLTNLVSYLRSCHRYKSIIKEYEYDR